MTTRSKYYDYLCSLVGLFIIIVIHSSCSDKGQNDLDVKRTEFQRARSSYLSSLEQKIKGKIDEDEIIPIVNEAIRNGYHLEVLRLIESEISKRPADANLHSTLANILHAQGLFEESTDYLENLNFVTDPNKITARLLEIKQDNHDAQGVKSIIDSIEDTKYGIFGYNLASAFRLNKQLEKALDVNYESIDSGTGSYFNSIYARNISEIQRKLKNKIVADYFYCLFQPNSHPKDFQRLSKYYHENEYFTLTSSSLIFEKNQIDKIQIIQDFQILCKDSANRLEIPLSIPSTNVGNIDVKISPVRQFNYTTETHRFNKIISINFDDQILKREILDIKVSFYTTLSDLGAWKRLTYRIFEPVNLIKIKLTENEILDKTYLEDQDVGDIKKLSSKEYEILLKDDKLIETVQLDFSDSNQISWITNKLVLISCLLAIVPLFVCILIYVLNVRVGVKFGLVAAALYILSPNILEWTATNPISWIESILAKYLSPETGFSQELLTTMLISIDLVSVIFISWFLRDLNRITKNLKFGKTGFFLYPIILPFFGTTLLLFYSSQQTIEYGGWYYTSYLLVFSALLIGLLSFLVMRRVTPNWIYILVGGVAGIIITKLASSNEFLQIGTNAIFLIGATIYIYGEWRKAKFIQEQPELQSSSSVVSRIEKDIIFALDKYSYLIKIGTIISGLAAFVIILKDLINH
ncbi:hypothetical protein [Marinoscillum sp. 108]|uniref:hypothetical protein n=1 Tax=Marinoscillum sp. 108 TaxID=2653151 RepID=UPI00135C4898|nr:hypothetical protein [Marinoscillum sp. 108]